MRRVWLPTVPYEETAQRPEWTDLPAAVRAAVEAHLGAPVTTVRLARGGFTRGFAAVLTPASGEPVFVKASSDDYLVYAYGREAELTAALPACVPAARPRWSATVDDWFILCLDAVDGHMPGLPWRPVELDAALAAWATAAQALREPPPFDVDLPHFSDACQESFTTWRQIAAHRAPVPPMPRYALAHLDDLAALEGRLAELAVGYRGLMHFDLRLDNVLISDDGAAWLCDWNWLCHGPAWFDTAALLVTAYASGIDADVLFAAHPTAQGAPADALDASLAALCGFWFSRAAQPSEASPSLSGHQRWSGRVALAWLAERAGWATEEPVLAPPAQAW
ncbi:MAG: aminoglycoside phosphotransferase family protein [Micromonosporaceae bacterium]